MMLLRAFSAEWLKLRRTIALKMVVLAPLAVVLLTLFMASQAPFSTLRRGPSEAWWSLARVNLQFWALLMLPLYVTLETALIAGIEHGDNQWKSLFARPVPRWAIYISKLGIAASMTAASAAILVAGVAAEGRLLHWYNADLGFGLSLPLTRIAGAAAQMTGLAFLFVTVQQWVSLRWRSFSIAIGFGIVAIVTSFGMLLAAGQYGTWPEYFPWSLPMLVLARPPHDIVVTLWVSTLAAVTTTVAGCVDFCRREVQ